MLVPMTVHPVCKLGGVNVTVQYMNCSVQRNFVLRRDSHSHTRHTTPGAVSKGANLIFKNTHICQITPLERCETKSNLTLYSNFSFHRICYVQCAPQPHLIAQNHS